MKTCDLTGSALDWAVAKCEAYVKVSRGRLGSAYCWDEWGRPIEFAPSTDWNIGGPIIEREGVALRRHTSGAWYAMTSRDLGDCEGARWVKETYKGCKHAEERRACRFSGHTPLVAAMRCYVASKLGNEVDIPEVLL